MSSEYEDGNDNRRDGQSAEKLAYEHYTPRIPAINEYSGRHIEKYARGDDSKGDKAGDERRVVEMQDEHGKGDCRYPAAEHRYGRPEHQRPEGRGTREQDTSGSRPGHQCHGETLPQQQKARCVAPTAVAAGVGDGSLRGLTRGCLAHQSEIT